MLVLQRNLIDVSDGRAKGPRTDRATHQRGHARPAMAARLADALVNLRFATVGPRGTKIPCSRAFDRSEPWRAVSCDRCTGVLVPPREGDHHDQVGSRGTTAFPDVFDWLESPLAAWQTWSPFAAPAVRVEDYIQDDRYVVRADLPGLDPEKTSKSPLPTGPRRSMPSATRNAMTGNAAVPLRDAGQGTEASLRSRHR